MCTLQNIFIQLNICIYIIYILILILMLATIVENHIQRKKYSYFPKYLNYNFFFFYRIAGY